jgi:hypothetical protein
VITDDWTRYGIGIAMLVLWAVYFRSGRDLDAYDVDSHG